MTKVRAAPERLREHPPSRDVRASLDAETRETYLLSKFPEVFSTSTSADLRNDRDSEAGGKKLSSPGGANEHGHVHGIFPFGDVEIRVNRFFDRNSRSIEAVGSHPPIPTMFVVPPTVWHSRLTDAAPG